MGEEIKEKNALFDVFLFETKQLIEQVESETLTIANKEHMTSENIHEIFRAMHTIKASAAAMGYHAFAEVAHAIENIFYFIREKWEIDIDYEKLCEMLLRQIDFMKQQLEKIEKGEKVEEEIEDILQENKVFLDTITRLSEEKIKEYSIVVYFIENIQLENVRAFNIIYQLTPLVEKIQYSPSNIEEEKSIPTLIQDGFKIHVQIKTKKQVLEEVLDQISGIKTYEIKSIESEEKVIAKEIELAEDTTKDSKIEKTQKLVGVSTEKLDKLMNFVGEIVIAQAMVMKNQVYTSDVPNNLSKRITHLMKLTDELQNIVMELRMVPISSLFNKMHRIVRDMGKKLDKDVLLKVEGSEVEIDKGIMEQLSDPLMHLIRNAVDHGIETKEERKRFKKPITGVITLNAQNTGGDVIITLSDDGRGLNKEAIFKKAIENGLIQGDKQISEEDLYNLILLPGFTTTDKVTEFSGRGVGMDVVKNHIEKVRGHIRLKSIEGKGTTIIMHIPLTLAIIDGMQLLVGENIYTIPTTSIKECLKIQEKDVILKEQENECLLMRENRYPIIRLYKHFGIENAITDIEQGIMIIIENYGQMLCLFADKLLGEQSIVIKALPEYFRHYPIKEKGIGGCTILGDGTISLMLDMGYLIEKSIK